MTDMIEYEAAIKELEDTGDILVKVLRVRLCNMRQRIATLESTINDLTKKIAESTKESKSEEVKSEEVK